MRVAPERVLCWAAMRRATARRIPLQYGAAIDLPDLTWGQALFTRRWIRIVLGSWAATKRRPQTPQAILFKSMPRVDFPGVVLASAIPGPSTATLIQLEDR